MALNTSSLPRRKFDVVIVGAGGSGMRASLQLARAGLNVAVLSKVAAYGFLRIVLPTFPDATIQYQEIVLVIAVLSILYGSAMAFTQNNIRLIAGYSSIAQLGFITLGIFALRPDGADGAVSQMFNHGLVVVPLFLIIALLYERYESEDIREMGGLRRKMPITRWTFLIACLAIAGVPGFSGFFSKDEILFETFTSGLIGNWGKVLWVVGAAAALLTAFYIIRAVALTFYGEPRDKKIFEHAKESPAVREQMRAIEREALGLSGPARR